MEGGLYVYCIIGSGNRRCFDGVAPIGSPGLVRTIPGGDLAAVVSDVGFGQYDSTRANLLAHQRVQERVMEEFPLLPVRFGTVANGAPPDQAVRRLLERRRQEFGRLLSEMEGKVELGLKALWRDEGAVFQEMVAEDAAVRMARDALQGRPPAATRYERIHLGEMVKAALERKRRGEAQRLLAPLRRLAGRVVENLPALDRMVANAAFLVGRQDEGKFDQAVGRLEEEHGQRLTLRYVGPTPPYNFVNIVVHWGEQ